MPVDFSKYSLNVLFNLLLDLENFLTFLIFSILTLWDFGLPKVFNCTVAVNVL